MIVYQKDGKNFILMANNSRGVMKLTADNWTPTSQSSRTRNHRRAV